MKNMFRSFAFVLLSIALVVPASASDISGKAPDFTLKSSSGKNLRLSDYRGNVVLLNFWASWCGPCRQEMPLLEAMYKKYKKLGFVILGVNVEQDSSKANAYLSDVSVSFPVLYDNTNTASKLYNVSAMPTTVIIDRNGNMRYLHKGYKPGYENDYKKQVKTLIRE
jgi:peroxiredoxin